LQPRELCDVPDSFGIYGHGGAIAAGSVSGKRCYSNKDPAKHSVDERLLAWRQAQPERIEFTKEGKFPLNQGCLNDLEAKASFAVSSE
jgi:hypothetical protein